VNARAGFATIDITPPLGTRKVGWLKPLTIERVRDRLQARAAVLEAGRDRIGFLQLDTLSVRWTTTAQIRRAVQQRYGVAGNRLMVAATHTHGGPAVANVGDVRRDDNYLAFLVEQCVTVFGRALAARQRARIGFGHCSEFRVSANRRVVRRDGTVQTHGNFADPNALCLEGPIDPEVAVLAARGGNGRLLGALVNFTCHPTHFGGGTDATAGWPGRLAARLRRQECPVTLVLNGAAGDIHHANPATGTDTTPDRMARVLGADVTRILATMKFRDRVRLSARRTTVQLPYRKPTAAEVRGTIRGAQRFIAPDGYDRLMPGLARRIRERGSQPAEIQALGIDEVVFVSLPAEAFARLGLLIKEQVYPRHAVVVGYANGMVGYVPHAAAFQRGGYETSFAPSSRLAPEAGDRLVAAAVRLVRRMPGQRRR